MATVRQITLEPRPRLHTSGAVRPDEQIEVTPYCHYVLTTGRGDRAFAWPLTVRITLVPVEIRDMQLRKLQHPQCDPRLGLAGALHCEADRRSARLAFGAVLARRIWPIPTPDLAFVHNLSENRLPPVGVRPAGVLFRMML